MKEVFVKNWPVQDAKARFSEFLTDPSDPRQVAPSSGATALLMPYLLDTNVVSELRKHKPHGAVLAWIEKIPDDSLYVSAVTLTTT
jgi:hypothetical protein